MYQQFPQKVIEKPRILVPRSKASRAKEKGSWIAYDTLFIDSKPIREVGVRRR
jgi:hypothetical protein